MRLRARSSSNRNTSPCQQWLRVVLLSSLMLGLAGCTREFFRNWADNEVTQLLTEKTTCLNTELLNYWVYPHPMARFADVGCSDCPPMPPDDPQAWCCAPKPQCPDGTGFHEGDGYMGMLRQFNAAVRATDAFRDYGKNFKADSYLVSLDQALELAVINSREYQARREDLYLAALPVTLERFDFLPQFLATQDAIRQWSASQSEFGPTNNLQLNPTVGVGKNFVNGAALLFRMANRTVVDLSSKSTPTLSQTTMVFDLVQPLLRGGGKAVALEPLTQSERDLLYEVRRFSRFHKEFYTGIVGGSASTTLVPGGSLQPGGVVRGAATSVGYLPTLQARLQLDIDNQNVRDFNALLDRYKSFEEGGGVSKLNTDLIELRVLGAKSTLLSNSVRYQDVLDQFKIQLGLPTDTPLELDQTPLRDLIKQIQQYQTIEEQASDLGKQLEKIEKQPDVHRTIRKTLLELAETSTLTKGTQFAKYFRKQYEKWREASKPQLGYARTVGTIASGLLGSPITPPVVSTFQALQDQGGSLQEVYIARAMLTGIRDDYLDEEKVVPESIIKLLREVNREFDFAFLENQLELFEAQPWLYIQPDGKIKDDVQFRKKQQQLKSDIYRRLTFRFSLLADLAREEREDKLGESWPALPSVLLQGSDLLKLKDEEAENLISSVALSNRYDMQNQQAQLADTWRKLAVFANSLLGTFDVRYNATVLTPPLGVGQPLNFDGQNARHQLIFNTELPFVRLAERNNYRAALIAFQRQRRNLQAVQDQVLFQVRSRLRRLKQLEANYQLLQKQLELNLAQVTNTLELLFAPPEPGSLRDTAATAAASTQQLVQAQQSVAQSQSALLTNWVQYLTTRMELYRDLELLEIDSRGAWINDPASRQPGRGTNPPPPASP